MTVTYELDRDARLIETRCQGHVTFDEVMGHFQQLEADATLPERLDLLLDLDEMTSVPDGSQLRRVAGRVDLGGRIVWGACAIVASRDALFGTGRVFEVFTEGVFAETRVFRARDEAERWLASKRDAVA